MKRIAIITASIFCVSTSSAQSRTKVHIESQRNFTRETDSVLREAILLIDSVINSDAFREGILHAKFITMPAMTNEAILRMFLNGMEVHGRGANDTMDLILETSPDQHGDNIGTTYDSKRIVSSRAYILRNGARCYAAHLIHEYCHTLGISTGFTHRSFVWSGKQRRQKCQSVPYIIGDLARKILGGRPCQCECENYEQT